jgi:hypothetical protein
MPKAPNATPRYTFGLDATTRARRLQTAETYSHLATQYERQASKCKPGGERHAELMRHSARCDGVVERCVQGV